MGFWGWLVGLDSTAASINTRMAQMDREVDRIAETCELCRGTAVYLCPQCRVPIGNHSHEHDYICDAHGFIDPIRASDGTTINGDGRI